MCLIKICLEDKKKELQLGIPHLPQSLILGHPFNLFFWNKRKKKVSGCSLGGDSCTRFWKAGMVRAAEAVKRRKWVRILSVSRFSGKPANTS